MGVERFKILKNLGLALIIAYVGLETGMNPYHIIGIILSVGAPDALELFLGNGLAQKMQLGNGGNDGDE